MGKKPSALATPTPIELLERSVSSGGSGLKSLPPLLVSARSSPAARHALRRAWTGIIDRGEMTTTAGSEASETVAEWLKERFEEYTDALVEWVGTAEDVQDRVAALRTVMFFASKQKLFDEGLLTKLFFNLSTRVFADETSALALPLDVTMRAFREEYLNSYCDVQLYFARSLRAVMKALMGDKKKKSAKQPFSHIALFRMVCWIPDPEIKETPELIMQNDEELKEKFTRRGFLFKTFQAVWLEFLRLPDMPLDVYRAALTRLPRIIPLLNQPLLLGDFLTDAFSAVRRGSEDDENDLPFDEKRDQIPFLALSSLFVLVRDYGMDYPNLYDRLYELVRPSLFYSSDRESFCHLLEACLKSPHIPAYLVAAFCKRLARVALLAPPSAALFALPMIYNLLRRHPSCVFLIHRAKLVTEDDEADLKLASRAGDEEKAMREKILAASRRLAKGLSASKPGKREGTADPFDFEIDDPEESKAANSCLWEIEALKHHYDPTVAGLARSVFSHDLNKDRVTKAELPIDDFLTTYQDLYAQESKIKRDEEITERKRRKVEAPLNVKKPGEDAFDGFVLFSE